jgi:hypothetical protein
MDRPKKLTSQKKTEELNETLNQQQSQSGASEFASVEEMLRHDSLHTPVPPAIAQRLAESVAQLPAPSRSWWRRLLGQ